VQKILVANRGEIAVRIVRACRDLGLASVAVYSACDRSARHVRLADEAVAIGGDAPADSYLRIDRLLDAARASGADAVHPGYGFLSESAAFASACRDASLTFIGPTPQVIARMGDKAAAREAARAVGVPIVPGTPVLADGLSETVLAERARAVGYPLMVKAVAGGGGKGLRRVMQADGLSAAVTAARSEARSAFGDGSLYFERWLPTPRHVEIQLLADHHGTVVPLVERECSVQRRHQKLLEESPSVAVSPALRAQLAEAARALAASVGYTNAGTVEFLLDEGGGFYFLEMNTRLQVEHPVTEMVTGLDLVAWQIRVARGERLTVDAEAALTPRGHAVECRVFAEDPRSGFLPSPGRIEELESPQGPGIRDDSGAEVGTEVSTHYDALISKLVVWGTSREDALRRLRRALGEYRVAGVRTTLPFFQWLLGETAFQHGMVHVGWLDTILQSGTRRPFEVEDPSLAEVALIAAALDVGRRVPVPPQLSTAWASLARREGLRG
jgi:acetyl-CoA carboxylase biotin carboxylase subunit